MTETTSPRVNIPLDPNDPMKFLDFVVLSLLQARSPQDVNELLCEFLTEDAVYFMSDNRALFFVVSEMWNETIRNVVLEVDDVTFPDGILGLPPLFHHLGWIQENPAWDPYHKRFKAIFEQDPCLVNAAVLLFIEGINGDLNKALESFNKRFEIVEENSLEEIDFNTTLDYFGWPVFVEAA